MYTHTYLPGTVQHAYKTDPVPDNVRKTYDRGEVEAWFVDLPASVWALVVRYHGKDQDFERLRYPSEASRREAFERKRDQWLGHRAALIPSGAVAVSGG